MPIDPFDTKLMICKFGLLQRMGTRFAASQIVQGGSNERI